MRNRAQPQIIAGVPQPLDETVLGARPMAEKFFERFLLINRGLLENAPFHVACHIISNLEAAPEPYAKIHCHPDHDEIGLVIGSHGALEYEMILDGKEHRVQSPAAFSIPAGTFHRARAVRGTGSYVCILLDAQGPRAANVEIAPELDMPDAAGAGR